MKPENKLEQSDGAPRNGPATGSAYMVVGDHPTLKRPDKRIVGFGKALEYAHELVCIGYENVEVKAIKPND